MKDKKEGNSICKWFKKKEPLSEKTNFDAAGKLNISTRGSLLTEGSIQLTKTYCWSTCDPFYLVQEQRRGFQKKVLVTWIILRGSTGTKFLYNLIPGVGHTVWHPHRNPSFKLILGYKHKNYILYSLYYIDYILI